MRFGNRRLKDPQKQEDDSLGDPVQKKKRIEAAQQRIKELGLRIYGKRAEIIPEESSGGEKKG